MVSFDAHDPGTSNTSWLQAPQLMDAPRLSLDHHDQVIVLAAHPDDETLGAGGLLATAAAGGSTTSVIIVTDGAAAQHVGSPSALARIRAAEATSALATLDPGIKVEFLDRPDGAIREEQELITGLLDHRLRHVSRSTLVLTTWRGDGHRDHRILGEIAVNLAARHRLECWEYPIWLWHWGHPTHPGIPWHRAANLWLDPHTRQRKQEALGHYASQTRPATSSQRPVLHRRFLANFDRPFETYFIRTAPSVDPGRAP